MPEGHRESILHCISIGSNIADERAVASVSVVRVLLPMLESSVSANRP